MQKVELLLKYEIKKDDGNPREFTEVSLSMKGSDQTILNYRVSGLNAISRLSGNGEDDEGKMLYDLNSLYRAIVLKCIQKRNYNHLICDFVRKIQEFSNLIQGKISQYLSSSSASCRCLVYVKCDGKAEYIHIPLTLVLLNYCSEVVYSEYFEGRSAGELTTDSAAFSSEQREFRVLFVVGAESGSESYKKLSNEIRDLINHTARTIGITARTTAIDEINDDLSKEEWDIVVYWGHYRGDANHGTYAEQLSRVKARLFILASCETAVNIEKGENLLVIRCRPPFFGLASEILRKVSALYCCGSLWMVFLSGLNWLLEKAYGELSNGSSIPCTLHKIYETTASGEPKSAQDEISRSKILMTVFGIICISGGRHVSEPN